MIGGQVKKNALWDDWGQVIQILPPLDTAS